MRLTVKTILLVVVCIAPLVLFAPPGGSWNPGNTDPTVPLSGGVVFLIISSILYGVKQFLSSRKK